MAGEPLERIAICRRLLWSHAEEKAHHVERPDKHLIQAYNQYKGDHGNDQIFRQNVHIPAYHEPTDAKDDGLVEDVEGQHRLVAVGRQLALEVKIPSSQAQHKYNPAPASNTHGSIEKDVHQ